MSEIRKKLEDELVPRLSWQRPEKHDSDSDSTCFEFEDIFSNHSEKTRDIPTTDDEIFSVSSPVPRIPNEDWKSIMDVLTNDDTYFSQEEIVHSLDLFGDNFNQLLNLPPAQTLQSNPVIKSFNTLSNGLLPSDCSFNQSLNPPQARAVLPNYDNRQSPGLLCDAQEIEASNMIMTEENVANHLENSIDKCVENFENSLKNEMVSNNITNKSQSSLLLRSKIIDDQVMEIGKTLSESLNIVSSSTSRSSSDMNSEQSDRSKHASKMRCRRGKVQRRPKKCKVKSIQKECNEMILMSDTPVEEDKFIDASKEITNVSYSLRKKKISYKSEIGKVLN